MIKLKRKKYPKKWSFEKGDCEECKRMYERALILVMPELQDFFKGLLLCENCNYHDERFNRFISVLRDTLLKNKWLQ